MAQSEYLRRATFRNGSNDFWARVETALLNTADNLIAEDPSPAVNSNHANRLAWGLAIYATDTALHSTLVRLKNRISQHWKVLAVGDAIEDTGQDSLQAVVDYIVTTADMPQA